MAWQAVRNIPASEHDAPHWAKQVLRISIALVATFGLFIHCARAQGTSPLEDRLLLGVGTHQGIGGPVSKRGYVPAINVGQMQELGVTAFRDDISWSDFELPGRRLGFTAPLSRLEAQIASGAARPLLILGSGHYLVPNSNPPTTDEARRRFVDYATAAARSVAARRPLFELWNEWNLKAKQSADFTIENYLALAKVTYPAVKKALPNAPFIIGAIGDDPGWTWTNSLFGLGSLTYADGISIHLYNFCENVSKRTTAEVIDRLTTLHRMAGQASGNPGFPIYLTEAGWPTATGKCGVNEQAEADNMAQLILWAATATPWLKGIWQYELKDSGTNPAQLEDNFGLYHFDNMPKPAACAVHDSWAFIRSSLKADAAKLAPDVTTIKSTSAAGQRMAVWAEDPSKHYEVRLKGEVPNVNFSYPCGGAPRPASGIWMTVSRTPLLISAGSSALPELQIRSAQ